MKSLLVLLFVAASQACAENAGIDYKIDWSEIKIREINIEPAKNYSWKDDEKITGGYAATPHAIPYQVGLFLTDTNGDQYFCGGSLISENYVMTAAHCADGISSVVVILGAQNILANESTQVKMNSTKLTVHPNWNSQLIQNDIALIKLPESATLNDYVKLADLPSRSEANLILAGSTAIVSGWGKTSDASTTISSVLRYVVSTILDIAQCSKAFPTYIQPTNICLSGSGGKSACSGDSGGPLTTTISGVTKQIGIVSFGSGKGCTKGYPSVYTRVTSYLDWIQKNTDLTIT